MSNQNDMSRRTAMLAMSAFFAVMAGERRVVAQESKPGESVTLGPYPITGNVILAHAPMQPPPFRLTLSLDNAQGFDFSYNGKTVSFTTEEMWDALSESAAVGKRGDD